MDRYEGDLSEARLLSARLYPGSIVLYVVPSRSVSRQVACGISIVMVIARYLTIDDAMRQQKGASLYSMAETTVWFHYPCMDT